MSEKWKVGIDGSIYSDEKGLIATISAELSDDDFLTLPASIVKSVNAYPRLVKQLQNFIDVAEDVDTEDIFLHLQIKSAKELLEELK